MSSPLLLALSCSGGFVLHLSNTQGEFGEFFYGRVAEIPARRSIPQAAAHGVSVNVEAHAVVVVCCLVGFAVFWFREDFEGPDFAGFRLHALQAAVVGVAFVAEEPAGAVAGAFDVEAA